MFLGTYHHSLDAKGRITIPVKYREKLGPEFVATVGLDDCIALFPMQRFEEESSKLDSLPMSLAPARGYERILHSQAEYMGMDKQGRVLLPAHLRQLAGIEKELVLIGANTRVEIWSKERWFIYLARTQPLLPEILAQLSERNF